MFNELTKALQVEHPVIQAPMAGGITTSELVSAVTNAGGLGMIGAGYMTAIQIQQQVQQLKTQTSKSFGINLFVPRPFACSEQELQAAEYALNPLYKQLNLPLKQRKELPVFKQEMMAFEEQLQVVLAERVPVCSFTFGIPSETVIRELRKRDIIVIGTAATVQEAIEIEKSGMDMIVVQGSEAGGHRGNFLQADDGRQVGLMSLIPQVVDKVKLPVIAAGGIMDKRGVQAALCLGAKGVQLGTAFLMCKESGAPELHKQAILQAREDETVLTRSFSGKWARGIENSFIAQMKQHEEKFPSFPVQNTLTKSIRKAASFHGMADYMSLWSGQSPRLAKEQTAASLMEQLIQ